MGSATERCRTKENGLTDSKSTDATSVDLTISPPHKTTRFDCPTFDG